MASCGVKLGLLAICWRSVGTPRTTARLTLRNNEKAIVALRIIGDVRVDSLRQGIEHVGMSRHIERSQGLRNHKRDIHANALMCIENYVDRSSNYFLLRFTAGNIVIQVRRKLVQGCGRVRGTISATNHVSSQIDFHCLYSFFRINLTYYSESRVIACSR